MKKILTIFLTAMLAVCLLCACESAPTTQTPNNPSNPPASTQTGDPEFPDNGFETDNETLYPDAWK